MRIATIQLSREETILSRKLLSRKTRDRNLADTPLVISLPVTGHPGFEIDIKCVNGTPPYVDPILFREGNEVGTFQVADSLEGEYHFEISGEEHQVRILADPSVK